MKHSIMVFLFSSASLAMGMEMSQPDKVVLRRVLEEERGLVLKDLQAVSTSPFASLIKATHIDRLLRSSDRVKNEYDRVIARATEGFKLSNQ